jgi:hypothetical protein
MREDDDRQVVTGRRRRDPYLQVLAALGAASVTGLTEMIGVVESVLASFLAGGVMARNAERSGMMRIRINDPHCYTDH